MLKALAEGADGVLITGCHPGECHYLEQNYKAMRRFHAAAAHAGPNGHRAGAGQAGVGQRSRRRAAGQEITKMVEEIRALGPLNWPNWLAPRPRLSQQSDGDGGAGMTANGKPKFAMYWAAACGGCEIAVLNIHEKILDVDANFEVVFWPVAMDAKYKDVEAMPDESITLCLFNGAHSQQRE